jgi:hypothetical protein
MRFSISPRNRRCCRNTTYRRGRLLFVFGILKSPYATTFERCGSLRQDFGWQACAVQKRQLRCRPRASCKCCTRSRTSRSSTLSPASSKCRCVSGPLGWRTIRLGRLPGRRCKRGCCANMARPSGTGSNKTSAGGPTNFTQSIAALSEAALPGGVRREFRNGVSS